MTTEAQESITAILLNDSKHEQRRERLAAHIHRLWSDWWMYHLPKCVPMSDGSLVVPPAYVEALRRQATTPYNELSESEKELDRIEALIILMLLDE